MKSLKTIIKENKKLITSNRVCWCSEGIVDKAINIDELDDYRLSRRYNENDWFIEDGDLCIKNIINKINLKIK